MNAALEHIRLLEEAEVMPNGRPYGCELFGGDLTTNGTCRRVVDWLERTNWYEPGLTILEIGSGGGRWSRYLATHCDSLICVDGTPDTARHLAALRLSTLKQVLVCKDGVLPTAPGEALHQAADLVFSYDTFVHFEPTLFWQYLTTIPTAIKDYGFLILHHGSPYDRQPGQPLDHTGQWHYYRDNDVDVFLRQRELNLFHVIRANEGYGSRIAIYKKDPIPW